jgi:hypothetical protein
MERLRNGVYHHRNGEIAIVANGKACFVILDTRGRRCRVTRRAYRIACSGHPAIAIEMLMWRRGYRDRPRATGN